MNEGMIWGVLVVTSTAHYRIVFGGQGQGIFVGLFVLICAQQTHCMQKAHQHSFEILYFENMTTDVNVWGYISRLPDGSQHIFPIRFMQ